MTPLPTCRPCEIASQEQGTSWLVESLWADQAVGIVGGEPKCCKSFLARGLVVIPDWLDTAAPTETESQHQRLYKQAERNLSALSASSRSGGSCHRRPERSGGAAKQLDSFRSGGYRGRR